VTIPGKRQDCYIGTENTTHRPPLSAQSFTVVEYHDASDGQGPPQWVFVKRQCMHCLHPACESACPVGAFHKTPEGPVTYDSKRCMGCRYCMMACPFSVPTYEWSKRVPYVRKCTMCVERGLAEDVSDPATREDHLPACVAACPMQALQFGERSQLLAEAHRRIAENPGQYVNEVYGEDEAGGTCWLYVSPVPFRLLGFPQRVGTRPYPEYTEQALDSVPPLIVFGGSVLAGVYTLWKRKLALAGQESQEQQARLKEKEAHG
jgi:formate dehydrogenase iron-sulfur subunit